VDFAQIANSLPIQGLGLDIETHFSDKAHSLEAGDRQARAGRSSILGFWILTISRLGTHPKPSGDVALCIGRKEFAL
jgi:hypothetical protein